VAALERFVEAEGIEVVQFRKGQRKDGVMAERLKTFQTAEGIVFIGKAQEKTAVFRTEKRRNPRTGQSYPWIVKVVGDGEPLLHLCGGPATLVPSF
jgi:hypothetical protein